MQIAAHAPANVPAELDPWLTLQQAAEHAQAHEATLRRWIRAGVLRHARVGVGVKHIRIRVSWLDAALESSTALKPAIGGVK